MSMLDIAKLGPQIIQRRKQQRRQSRNR